jgi:hypothetical protein
VRWTMLAVGLVAVSAPDGANSPASKPDNRRKCFLSHSRIEISSELLKSLDQKRPEKG